MLQHLFWTAVGGAIIYRVHWAVTVVCMCITEVLIMLPFNRICLNWPISEFTNFFVLRKVNVDLVKVSNDCVEMTSLEYVHNFLSRHSSFNFWQHCQNVNTSTRPAACVMKNTDVSKLASKSPWWEAVIGFGSLSAAITKSARSFSSQWRM